MIAHSLESDLPPNSIQIGIFDEAEPLRAVSTWGAIGAEAVLAQCYPKAISLFYQSFDVITARQEGINYAAILQDHGVKVLMVRDLLAETLKPRPLRKDAVIAAMVGRAQAIQNQYDIHVEDSADLITMLVEQDIVRYGEEGALNLNQTLSVDPQFPLGNSLYGRDHMNVLCDTRVVSRMAKAIRRHEVDLYELVYQQHLAPHTTIIIPSGETFEGGDAYIHNGTVFVGVGTRTTLGAAVGIYQALKPQLEQCCLKFAVVEDEDPFGRSFSEQQDSMHLDTFSNPVGKREIAVCIEEARRRRIRFLNSFGDNLVINDGFGSFIDFLEQTEDNIVIIPQEEQKGFGCNFLLKGEDSSGRCVIFVPLRYNTDTNNQLRGLGKQVVHTDLFESTKGYGAAHCMTGQLLRSNI
ncbi:MAG: arginine deiminase family protein [Candidatus Daviesbacteria bacterium]|nr:arginine deiminase family protein [Candidatus Daviesbacteria bacterium]